MIKTLKELSNYINIFYFTMSFLKRIYRIPLFPRELIYNPEFKNLIGYSNIGCEKFRYDMEYLHNEIVPKGKRICEMSDNIPCEHIDKYIYSPINGRLVLANNMKYRQPGLTYLGTVDYTLNFWLNRNLTNRDIERLTLGWIVSTRK
jgi:hypothetical protein